MELHAHIKEMEAQGFDLSEYKEAMEEKIGGATAEEVAAAKKEALEKDRHMYGFIERGVHMDKTIDKEKISRDSLKGKNPAEMSEEELRIYLGCARQCETCSRIHCQFRKK